MSDENELAPSLFGAVGPRPGLRWKKLGSPADAELVWKAWLERQQRPGLCRYTAERSKLLRERLGLGYTAADLIAVIHWVYDCDAYIPRFLRGENDQRTSYLDPESLFREKQLGSRVHAALLWQEEQKQTESQDPSPPGRNGLRVVPGGRSMPIRPVQVKR